MHQYSVIQKNLVSLFSGKAAIVQACWTCVRCTGLRSCVGCLCPGASLSRGRGCPVLDTASPWWPQRRAQLSPWRCWWCLWEKRSEKGQTQPGRGRKPVREAALRAPGERRRRGKRGRCCRHCRACHFCPKWCEHIINKESVKWKVFYWCRHKIKKSICFYLVRYSSISYISGSMRH